MNLPPPPAWGAQPSGPADAAPTPPDGTESYVPGARYTVTKKKRFGAAAKVLLVVLLLAGAAGVYVVVSKDDPETATGPIELDEWAAQYCNAFDPYKADGSKLFTTISANLTPSAISSPDTAKKLDNAISGFGKIAQTFLDDIAALTKNRTISDAGGPGLQKDLTAGITQTQGTVSATLEAINGLDANAPDYAARALVTLKDNGLSLESRVKVAPSSALDRLNQAIAKQPNCTSVFVPAAVSGSAGLGGVDAANSAACGLELQTLQTAVKAYSALNGSPPDSESALVPDFLERPSDKYGFVIDAGKVSYLAEDPSCPAPG